MPEPENNPTTIGRYDVKRLLGAGAMGSVYLAEDPRIKRKLAIKVVKLDAIRSEAERKEFLARFQREAEVSGLLNHPGIVTIYDVGDSDLGPFLAMEYVPGRPLDALIKSGEPMELRVKLQIAAGIAEALDHAHCHGIVHRDVKPGNVMISEEGRPKLMDFGIAKKEDANLTQTGTFLGTPSYASPEQIKDGNATNRSDIFSLGVMVFEMLSGSLPFPGNSINTILYRIVNEPPVEINPPVMGLLPESWHRIFHKVMAKNPQERYSTCSAFVRDLLDAAVDLDKQERMELMGVLRMGGSAPAPPVLHRAHEETMFVPSEASRTQRRRRVMGRAGLAAAGALVLGAAAFLLFARKGGADMVAFSCLPEKAEVLSGTERLGYTPGTFPVKPGQRVTLNAPGFKALEIQYAPGKATTGLKLEAIVSEERIQSDPAEAELTLDGKPMGRTPVTVAWNQGESHRLTLVKGPLVAHRDFEPGSVPKGILQMKDGDSPASGAPEIISENAAGQLRVAGGFSVRVKVDGADRGELRPGASLELPPGQHTVDLSNPKVFYKDSQRIKVDPGKPAVLRLPDTVSVTVNTHPNSGPVLVDGLPSGVESDGGSPITLVKGTHRFSIQGRSGVETRTVEGGGEIKFKY